MSRLRTIAFGLSCALLGAPAAYGIPMVAGFNSIAMAACDDATTGPVALGFSINFLGGNYDRVFVNNNGNVIFGSPLTAYTPFNLAAAQRVMIAPFFADVDTRGVGSDVTRYGTGTFAGHDAFGVTWDGVGYYSYGADKLNKFQLLLVDREDVGPGDFDIYFNYDQIQWEAGNASGGRRGVGGFTARAGYSNGDPKFSYELPGSAQSGAFLDGSDLSLVAGSNIGVPGRYLFEIRNGVASTPEGGSTLLLLGLVLGVMGLLQSPRIRLGVALKL